MKKFYQLPLLLVALLVTSLSATAHDFEVDGIYYNITDSTALTVEVTYSGSSATAEFNEYSGDIIIPESVSFNGNIYSVTSIGTSAFYGCSSITEITIPNSVTYIGDKILSNCLNLTSIIVENNNSVYDSRDNCNAIIETASNTLIAGCQNTIIPNTVTTIGDNALYSCRGLTSVTIPNSVTYIGNLAFNCCHELTSITIPNSLISIGKYVFSYCDNLTSIVVENGNTVYDSRDNCNAIIETASNTLIAGCQNSIISNSVTSIGDYAFYGCSGLTSVTIGNSVTSIGSFAFSICDELTSITIPNSVTSIGGSAFWYCSSLTSVKIPNSVTLIDDCAFGTCNSLTSIEVESGNTVYDSRDNCNAIIETATNTLISGCKNTFIPNSVTSIGGAAFYGCDGLTSVTIPDSVTRIGDQAFRYCDYLTSITLGKSVSSIDFWAFQYCYALTSITSLNPEPPTCKKGAYIFDSVPTDCTLYVPFGAKGAYEAADVWKEFTNIVELPEEVEPTEPEGQSFNLTKIWQNTTSVPGNSSGGDIRYAAVSNGHLIASDKSSNKIIEITETGTNDYIDLSSTIAEYYNDSILGVAISCDEAGNILINSNFPTSKSGTNFTIISADLSKTYKLDLSPIYYEFQASRIDQIGRICGNMLSDEGAYVILPPIGSSNAYIVKIVNGEIDFDYSLLSSNIGFGFGIYNDFAQPAYSNVTEFNDLMDETGDLSNSFILRRRSDPQVVYSWNTDNSAMYPAYTFNSTTPEGYTTRNASIVGFDWFKLDGKSYFIMPLNIDGTSAGRSSAWAIFDQDGEIVAYNAENIKSSIGFLGSFIAVPNNDYSVYIYHFIPGIVAEKYLFEIEKADGIDGVVSDTNIEAIEVARYDIHGRLLTEPTHGINIVVYSDGTTRKEIVR